MLVLQSVLLSVGIEVFGWVTNVVCRYLGNGQNSAIGTEKEKIIQIFSQETCECTLDEVTLRFWPPLYVQRYTVIEEILMHPIWNGSIKKVVDFGCAELSLFKHLKSIPEFNSLMFVDVDFNTLDMSLNKVMPTNNDYLSMGTRKEQLTVDVYNGSIADLDDRMLGVDAVIAIELIEHLYSEVLDAVPRTVFEFIKPKLAIFTTPNVEFNVLFPNFTTEFRHDDHKFEWTRKQLNEWAEKIITRYPDYSVQFDGIGSGPSGTENLGCCTQMALFYRKDMKTSPGEPIGCTPYNLLRRVSFPFEQYSDNYIRERTIFDKLRQFISETSSNEKYIVNGYMEVPLKTIMPYVLDCCSSTDELEEFVSKLYQTKKNDIGEWLLVRPSSEFISDDEISDSDSYSDLIGQESSTLVLEDKHNYNDEEDWSPTNGMSFGDSKFCFSTPMTKNVEPKIYVNNVDSFDTVFTDSELYKTAFDYNKTEENKDENISSCVNGSIDISECTLYKDFIEGRNNSVLDEEGIVEVEKTLMRSSDSHKLYNDNNEDVVISSSFNGSINIDDCKLYEDFIEGRTNSVISEEGIIETENTVMYSSDSSECSINNEKDVEISSSFNGSINIGECKLYKDFIEGRGNSVISEEGIIETEKTVMCSSDRREFFINNEKDVDISSSFNGSVDIVECKLYEDFIEGRNKTVINEEDIIKIEGTVVFSPDCNKLCIDNDKATKYVIKDKTDLLNDSITEDQKYDDEEVCIFNRTLLDESGYTENMLNADL